MRSLWLARHPCGGRRGAVILPRILFLAADLFALWLPVAVRRKAEREKMA